MDLENLRLENLRQKQKLLAELNLESLQQLPGQKRNAPGPGGESARGKKQRRVIPAAPSRTSARIASHTTQPSYREEGGERYTVNGEPPAIRNSKVKDGKINKAVNAEDDATDGLLVLRAAVDVDAIQASWMNWKPVGPPPIRDEQGVFHFDDFPTFTPNKSPEEIIREGAFGGSYFRPLKSRRLNIIVEGDWRELPSAWVTDLDIERYLTSGNYDPDANKFKVACGQSIEEWEANGWIAHDYDIRGWYQWYCRFWMGRRCDDDDRQVSRWVKCVGPRGRWKRLLLKKYVQLGVKDVFDDGDEDDEAGQGREVSPVMHQTCHHWAFEVRQDDLDQAWQEFG